MVAGLFIGGPSGTAAAATEAGALLQLRLAEEELLRPRGVIGGDWW